MWHSLILLATLAVASTLQAQLQPWHSGKARIAKKEGDGKGEREEEREGERERKTA